MQALGLSGLRLDRCTVDLQALDVALLCKNKEEWGSMRASPVAASMPKSVSFLRENMDCLEGECVAYEYASESAYLSPLGWPCIYSRCSTSWIATRIRSNWMRFSCYQYRIR